MIKIAIQLFLVFSAFSVLGQETKILSGPMLGYNTMREVAIWIQTNQSDYLKVKYWPKEKPDSASYSASFFVEEQYANTATIALEGLEPGTTYEFMVENEQGALQAEKLSFTTQELWHWRKDPPNFSFLAGSCNYINEPKYDRPGKGYGGEYPIFEKMAKEDADFMIWLGDNNYLREVDWNSRSGIYHRYTHSRAVPEMQKLLQNMHHYAIWDDHDYGPNDSDYTFWNKDITREAFEQFWANPNYGVNGLESVTGTFVYNDCQFFLMDNRWYRTSAGEDGKILGDEQLLWLIDALRYSKANFKFVCIGGQVVSDFKKYENYAMFPKEREKLLSLIDQYDIKNVVFLTGDRHHSEISMLQTEDGDKIYDITASPLTSTAYDHEKEPNTKRYKKAIFGERNYAEIVVEGPFKKRTCKVIFKDIDGKELGTYQLEF